MMHFRSSSRLWRATCSFSTYKSNIYRDYMRGKIGANDILQYVGDGQCLPIDFIDIRGNRDSNTTVPFWQSDSYQFHTDSTLKLCQFDGFHGSVVNEDNFGYYLSFNSAFRCTESQESTTQYWFGIPV